MFRRVRLELHRLLIKTSDQRGQSVFDDIQIACSKPMIEMDDYAIEIVQNIRETDEWKRDDSFCERIGICLGFYPKFTRKCSR